ncbi:MAG TPA: fibronectin type III domain-containing protein [Nitrosopumilaceae archaeon]|nr:fibronectin type III domain-containing protein [Nitrosopumilaceae archaeon]
MRKSYSVLGMILVLSTLLIPAINMVPVNAIGTPVTINVNSVDLSGNAFTGMYIELENSNGVVMASGFTPASFSAISGQQYIVFANNYQNFVFNHWDDGTTSQARPITPTQTVTLTASYSTGTAPTAPGAPTGLTANTVSTSQINLSWTAPASNGGSAITGYMIERSTDSGTTWSTIQSNTGSTATTFSDTGLTASTAYMYRVSAINAVGTSVPSNTASATTSGTTTAPQPPTGLTASTISTSQINLSWTTPSNNGGSAITGYKIERSTDSGTTWSTISANTASTSTTFSDTGLTASTTYTYRVSAINAVGTSSPSNTASATTSGTTSNAIVLNGIQTTSGTVSAAPFQITLANFNAGTGTNRELVVGVDANNNVVTSVTFGGVQLTKVTSSFANNDAEFWSLTNPSGTGNIIVTMGGATSAVIGAYSFAGIDQTTPIPTSTTNHNSATGSSPTISITTKNANSWVLDSPSIYGGKTLGSPTCTQQWDINVPNAITGASSSSIVSSPSSATCSWTASGGGDLWDDVAIELKASGTGTAPTAPGAPTNLAASTVSSSQINLSWTAPSNNGGSAITGYKIERSTDSGTTWSTIQSNTASTSTTYSDTGLAASTAYTYRVSAINAVGTGNPSNTASATTSGTAPTAPQPPTGLTANTVSSSQINLSWTAPSNNGGSAITGYKIERSTDGGTTWSTISANTASTSTTFSDTGLAASTTYTYRVSAINAVGTSSPSNTASATTSPVSTVRGISLNTNSVNVGTDVRITGTKFAPNSGITISYDSTTIGVGAQDNGYSTTPLTITTDSNGNFVAIMSTLISVTGKHTITAVDASKNSASQTVTVSPHAYLFPTTGRAGSTVLIPTSQGNGYAASSAITIKFDGTLVTPTTAITSDTTGNFGGSFMIPGGAASGPHTITISDASGNTYSTSFTVDPNAHSFSSQTLISGLNFPAYFAFIPDNGPGVDGTGAFMVNEKNTGNVIVFKNVNGMFVRQTVPFVTVPNLQINYETNGLLGITFDPNWATSSASKYVYLYVTRTVATNVVGELIRYHATTDSSGNIIADKSVGEQMVLGNIPAFNNGHNGGSLKFDSQGNLYISTGDGWKFNGQDLTTLQAKMLRIMPLASPVNGMMYSIPSTNPFASSTNTSIKKEIWAYGVRNPYTFDIDSQTGRIYGSDPGFNTWERIEDYTAAGANPGWANYESPPFGNPQNVAGYTPPLYWYPHQGVEPQTGKTAGLEALSAGAFYRGTTYPNLSGAYFFGDYGIGNILALLPSSVAPPTTDAASGYPIGQVVPLLYGLTAAPIYMQEWNGKIYFMDLSGNINVLNYN